MTSGCYRGCSDGECYCETPAERAERINPICGHLDRSTCRGCGTCMACDDCYCGED
jgi:hypothetical protein